VRGFFNEGEPECVRWIERARKGDARSWDSIVERYQNLVYSVARRTGVTSADADDIFQTTFLALYRNLDRIENPATLARWLAITASREAIRVKRLQSRYASTDVEGPTLEEILADEDATAEQTAIQADEAEYWRYALVKLGGRCEVLLRALYFEEKAYEDIVVELGMPIGAIGPTRARCLDKLRRLYQSEHPGAQD